MFISTLCYAMKNNNDPIFDQHTLRSMWRWQHLTNKERDYGKPFNEQTSKGTKRTVFSMHAITYLRFTIKMQKLYWVKKLDTLLMPLGKAWKRTLTMINISIAAGLKKSLTINQPTGNVIVQIAQSVGPRLFSVWAYKEIMGDNSM